MHVCLSVCLTFSLIYTRGVPETAVCQPDQSREVLSPSTELEQYRSLHGSAGLEELTLMFTEK